MVLIGALLFFILAYYYRRMVLMSFLFIIYALSFVATFLLQVTEGGYDVSPGSFIYLLFILLLSLIPFYGRMDVSTIHSNDALVTIARLFSFFLVPATIYYGYYGILTFTTVDLTYARADNITLLPADIFNTVFSFFSTLYFIPMFLYYVFYREGKYPILRNTMLFSTLSFPLLTLCYSGRDGLIYWGMNMIVFYLLFRSGMSKQTRNKIRLILIFLSLLAALVFLTISEARFSHREGGLSHGLLSYLGMQSHHFSVAYGSDFLQGRGSLFPGWKQLLGIKSEAYSIYDYAAHGMIEEYNVFSFYVKTLMTGYGKFGAIAITLIIGLIIRRFQVNYIKRLNIIDFIVVITLFQIPMNGVFYYRQGIGKGDVIYTLFLAGLLFFRYLKNGKAPRN